MDSEFIESDNYYIVLTNEVALIAYDHVYGWVINHFTYERAQLTNYTVDEFPIRRSTK